MSTNSESNIQAVEEEGNISIMDIIQIGINLYHFLKNKWIFIALASAIGFGAGLYFAMNEKPTYKAVLTFALEEDKGPGAGVSGIASQIGLNLGGDAGGNLFSGQNLLEIMKSQLMVRKTLLKPITINSKETTLADYYIKIYQIYAEDYPNKTTFYQLKNFSRTEDSTIAILYKNIINDHLIVLQPDAKISILKIEVNSIDELFSKLFCEHLIQETSDFYGETKSKKSRINVNILQHQADSLRMELNSAITGVAVAVDNVYNLNPALNVRKTTGAKKQIDVQTTTVMLTQVLTNLEMGKLMLRKETPLIQVIDKPILPLEITKKSKRESALGGSILFGCLSILFFLAKKYFQKMKDQLK
ncbi:GumC domain-containing protein [Aquirufa salirivi]|uniref:Lipopolysaccharide biosynthesis protein n=1 Tax=Aquirufa salirivi TaxID=3104729 RepID=A0ABW8RQF3_9BACT